MDVRVVTETGPLRRVIIRRPGPELERVTPDNMAAMLVDDLLDVPEAQREHDIFVSALKMQDIETIDFDELIKDLLNDDGTRETILKAAFGKRLNAAGRKMLNSESCSTNELFDYLVSGEPPENVSYLPSFMPVVNMPFTRDVGSVVGSVIIPGMAYKQSRKREMRVARAVFNLHPMFSGCTVLDCTSRNASIEGGDIIVASEKVVCIGISERTKKATVEAVAAELFNHGQVKTVIGVNLERKRSCMHLDTIFTIIDDEHCLCYTPMIVDVDNPDFCTAIMYKKDESPQPYDGGILAVLADCGVNLTPVSCGGSDPVMQQREQYTDGANSLAIRQGHIFLYNRNRVTIEMLKDLGYTEISAEEAADRRLDHKQKYVITMPGFELSRARGGAHCLSFPVLRT